MSFEAVCPYSDAEQPARPINFDFVRAVLSGLAQERKAIPSRFFYDARGSELFEEITTLPEYYPTRTEIQILTKRATDIAADTPAGSVLIEFGSGSSVKTELLLAALPDLYAYVPIDISTSALDDASKRLTKHFPALRVLPIVGDFSRPLDLDEDLRDRPHIGFFPGSTIGNLNNNEAVELLQSMATLLGPGGRLITGVDLKKDEERLVAAYSDPAGVTAEFNFNLLERINRELGANFDVDEFDHLALYNQKAGRMESYLVSRKHQSVSLFEHTFTFKPGEAIHTENSHKYHVHEFAELAGAAGWSSRNVWKDCDELFSVHDLVVA